jgi:hypothetical protein
MREVSTASVASTSGCKITKNYLIFTYGWKKNFVWNKKECAKNHIGADELVTSRNATEAEIRAKIGVPKNAKTIKSSYPSYTWRYNEKNEWKRSVVTNSQGKKEYSAIKWTSYEEKYVTGFFDNGYKKVGPKAVESKSIAEDTSVDPLYGTNKPPMFDASKRGVFGIGKISIKSFSVKSTTSKSASFSYSTNSKNCARFARGSIAVSGGPTVSLGSANGTKTITGLTPNKKYTARLSITCQTKDAGTMFDNDTTVRGFTTKK